MKHTASFDVFDTLLTRKVASPTSLFLVVGDRAARAGLIETSAADFREKRVRAEQDARVSAAGHEVNFGEIYRLAAAKLNLPTAICESLAHLELEVESELLVPVPGAIDLVHAARRKSESILFVSDMYLPSAFIREQLERHGFWQAGDRIYVSNEWRASKAEGSLFRRILETEQLRPEALHHTGDRIDADFQVPSSLGIRARHLDACHLTRYELMLEEFAAESAGFSSLIAGASRLTRLQAPAATSHLAVLAGIASSVISPVITLYALWLLREAKQRGLQRLYFVARDGYLVKAVADALVEVFGLSIETRYLYGSRQAWHLPAITEYSIDSLSWLFERTRTLTLRIILGRLQMAPEHIAKILWNLGWPKETWDQSIDEEALSRMKAAFLGSVEFRAHVERLVIERREIALHYLAQEGLFDKIKWAIVDLGWHGRLQHSLERILGMRQPTRALGLYFALYADSPALAQLQTASYLDWDLRSPPESKDIPSLVFLMESFCTAPHGSTIGYRVEDGKVVPVCRQGGFGPLEAWGVSTVHATVKRFAGELTRLSCNEDTMNWDSHPALIQILQMFSKSPLPDEARAWGAFPYEDEQAGSVRERLTAGYELTWENIRIALTFGDQKFLPASWKVLWHGGQMHTQSASNTLLRVALKMGETKRKIGNRLRGSLEGRCRKQVKAASSE